MRHLQKMEMSENAFIYCRQAGTDNFEFKNEH